MIRHAKGPKVDAVDRAKAIAEVKAHLPEGTDFDVFQASDHWFAAWQEPQKEASWKQAEFPPSGGDEEESGAPEEKSAPPEKSEDSDGSSEGPPSGDGGEGPPKKEHGGEGEGHEKKEMGELGQLLDIVLGIAQALGIEPAGGPNEGALPGDHGEAPLPPPGPAAPPHGGPPHGGPPGGPGGPGAGGPGETIQHQRALKPGETPPGGTPVGAPAFSSTLPPNHPWKDIIGKAATFTVESDPLSPTDSLAPIHSELERVAWGTGYRVAQFTEATDESGKRVARALLSTY